MFFHSFGGSKARKVSSEKRGGAEDRLLKMSTKFAPCCGARAGSAKKRHNAACPEHFWKLSFAKIAPCCGASAILKSTSQKKIRDSEHLVKLNFAKFAPRCGARAI